MSFYSALIDLLGRCAPEMHVRLSMTTVTGSVIIIMGRLETQKDIPSSSSSTQVKGKRSEFGPSFALWFLLSTSWESSASLQKCPWLIKVRRDEEPRTYFGPCCGLLFHFGGFPALFPFIPSSDGSVTEPDMSACFCPDHKAPMVLFLERVYNIQDQNFLMHMLEVGFLPDLRASASLDTVGTKQATFSSQNIVFTLPLSLQA